MSAPALAVQIQGQGAVSADNLNTFAQTTDLAIDLRAFIGTQGMEVLVRGTTVVNDSGGGAFYWNPTGTGPDDGVNTIVPNGAAIGCWVRVNSASVQNNVTLTGTTTLPGGGRISSAGFLGLGMVPVNVLDITQSGANAPAIVEILNANAGTAATSEYKLGNGASISTLKILGNGYTPNGIFRADGTMLLAAGAGGLSLGTSANQPVYIVVSNTEVARFTASRFNVGATVFSSAIACMGGGSDNAFTAYNQGNNYMFAVNASSLGVATGDNAANAMVNVRKDSGTNRSINAAGTINASGADYAEYEKKASNCGAVAKGQIIGFDRNGYVTDKWKSVASRFGVKSTDPTLVGGDTWGTEEILGLAKTDTGFAAALESARDGLDRIAYAGKCPCNVIGAYVGDYIVPEADGIGIKGVPITAPTFDQYRAAVGRVVSLLPDGRCTIALMVH